MRFQSCNVQCEWARSMGVDCVPQGHLLGPFLFVVEDEPRAERSFSGRGLKALR